MIPEFPTFKNLELSDKPEVEKFASQFPPYSDFNFVSMWSWDIKGEMGISQLNKNLVVRFNNYLTGEPLYSFLGDHKVNETVKTLLDFTIEEEVAPKLYLVSEESVKGISRDKFTVEEDPDNFDYIFDLMEISKYAGSRFMKKRNKINQFTKLFPRVEVVPIDIKDEKIKKHILELDELWLSKKIQKDPNFRVKNELLATNRFFQSSFENALAVGIFSEGNMLGYSVIVLLPNKYVISHFTKADTSFVGIYDFFIREIARMLVEKGYTLMNYEQDLGLPGLRESKKSFMSGYLKKFIVGFTR